MASDADENAILTAWRDDQEELQKLISTENSLPWQNSKLTGLKYIAGLDISYPKDAHNKATSDAFAAIVICEFPSLNILHKLVKSVKLDKPYVPGFLAFRELPALLEVVNECIIEKPELKPDVILVDGNGTLHPRQCGIACHIGFKTQISTIGVAKNFFHIEGIELKKVDFHNLEKVGDFKVIEDEAGHVYGRALKTSQDAVNPVYVSVGHKISLETATKVVLSSCLYRVPEPLRHADFISREYVRNLNS